ncbi:MAG: ABC transporter ATP-binding protein [Gemmatimonadaceae bacterium]
MIEARGVTKSYGRLDVLQGVDLDVEAAHITAIVGPNASGKTTFNKIVLGLVRPDSGTVRFDGAAIGDDAEYRRRIGYMPQVARYPENLCAHDVFAMLTDLRGPGAPRDEELVELFQLDAIMRAPLRTLSGGMRQRVNAALAFLFRPDLLILDEPTAGLDPISSSTLKDKMLRERSAGRTFIITSHVLSELEELSDRIIFLLDGRVRFSGTQHALKDATGESTLERAIAHLMRSAPPPPALPGVLPISSRKARR